MSIRFIWFVLLFKSSISLLSFCMVVLSIIESGVLQCPIICMLLSVSPLSSLSLFHALVLWCLVPILIIVTSCCWIKSLSIYEVLLCTMTVFDLNSIFHVINIVNNPCSPLIIIHMKYLFLFQHTYIFRSTVSFF